MTVNFVFLHKGPSPDRFTGVRESNLACKGELKRVEDREGGQQERGADWVVIELPLPACLPFASSSYLPVCRR